MEKIFDKHNQLTVIKSVTIFFSFAYLFTANEISQYCSKQMITDAMDIFFKSN